MGTLNKSIAEAFDPESPARTLKHAGSAIEHRSCACRLAVSNAATLWVKGFGDQNPEVNVGLSERLGNAHAEVTNAQTPRTKP